MAEQSTPPVLASPKPLQERSASAKSRLMRRLMSQLMRPVLRQALLRGLRPVRLSHDPSRSLWGEGVAELRTLRLTGARGQQLAAWLALPGNAAASDPVPVVVALHGWGANASTLSPMVAPLVRAGMAVLLFDATNHGQSSSENFSSLPRFAEDLAAVRACLHTMPAVDSARCAVLGHSVGAAAVLLHAARHDDVRAVVSLSAFAHPAEVMARWLREHHIPRRGIGTAILDEVQRTIGTRFEHIAPVHVMARLRCPVMLVHGQQDEVVPLSDAQRLQARAPHAELLVVEGGHDIREALQPHTARLVAFLARHLDAQAP